MSQSASLVSCDSSYSRYFVDISKSIPRIASEQHLQSIETKKESNKLDAECFRREKTSLSFDEKMHNQLAVFLESSPFRGQIYATLSPHLSKTSGNDARESELCKHSIKLNVFRVFTIARSVNGGSFEMVFYSAHFQPTNFAP